VKHGSVGCGAVWLGLAGMVRFGKVGCGTARSGGAGEARLVLVW